MPYLLLVYVLQSCTQRECRYAIIIHVKKFFSLLLYFASFVILSPHDCFVLLILVHCAMLSNWQLLLLILPGHHRSLQHSRAAHPHTCRARDVSDASSRRDVTSLTDRCCVHATAGVIVVAAAADSLIACQVNYCHLEHVFDSTHCCVHHQCVQQLYRPLLASSDYCIYVV